MTVTFLRHSLIAVRGYLREYEVYEAVQASAKGSQASVHFLNLPEGLAQTYVAIFNPEHEAWNTYPDSMRRAIQTLNIKPMRPLMLAVASKFPPKEANDAFRLFITWGVRLMIASSTRSGSVEEPLAASAQKVFAGDIATASSLKKEMASVIPADEQFRQAFEVATVSKAVLARYYLRSLEMAAKNEATPWFVPNDDRQTINLEHVLPERFDGQWGKFDQDSARAYVKKIGNLTLLLAKSNSDLRSADFKKKRAIYKKSPYELTRQISTVSEWSEEQIAKRQKGLAELALKAWPLKFPPRPSARAVLFIVRASKRFEESLTIFPASRDCRRSNEAKTRRTKVVQIVPELSPNIPRNKRQELHQVGRRVQPR